MKKQIKISLNKAIFISFVSLLLSSADVFNVNQNPIIINTIPGEALINLEINPDASTISTVKTIPAAKPSDTTN